MAASNKVKDTSNIIRQVKSRKLDRSRTHSRASWVQSYGKSGIIMPQLEAYTERPNLYQYPTFRAPVYKPASRPHIEYINTSSNSGSSVSGQTSPQHWRMQHGDHFHRHNSDSHNKYRGYHVSQSKSSLEYEPVIVSQDMVTVASFRGKQG